MVEVNTIRDKADKIPNGAMSEAYQDLLATPTYTLYAGVPAEEVVVEHKNGGEQDGANNDDE